MTPETAAGRALAADMEMGRLGLVDTFGPRIVAIEAEARAAALDEARALFAAVDEVIREYGKLRVEAGSPRLDSALAELMRVRNLAAIRLRLPATPAASGDVDAARSDTWHEPGECVVCDRAAVLHAAIRAESAGLDVSDERLGDAIHNAAHPHHPWSGCQYPDIWYHKVRLFRARLAEDAE